MHSLIDKPIKMKFTGCSYYEFKMDSKIIDFQMETYFIVKKSAILNISIYKFIYFFYTISI